MLTRLFSLQANSLEADSVHAGQAGERTCRGLHQRDRSPVQKPCLETSHDRYPALENQQQHRGNR